MNVRRLFPFALFALLFATAIRPTVDPDMWWHLRTGEAILDGGIPRTDIFSFTYPNNEWVTHEWLTDVIMWGLYRLGGLGLLQVVFAAVTTLTWVLVYRLCSGRPYIAGLTVAVAAKASQVVWGVRPQLFNLLLFATFIYLLERRKDLELGPWVFVTFPVLTALWANLHSGYLLGIFVLGTYLVGEWMERRRARTDPRTLERGDLVRLGAATVGSLLAALLNPNGIRLWTYPFETLGSSVQRDLISEWFPPAPHQLIFWLTVLLVAAGIVGMWRSSRRPAATELLLFAGTAAGAFLSVRNIPIFAVAATPIIAGHLATAVSLERFLDRESPLRRAPTLAAGAVLALAAAAMGYATIEANDIAIAETFPVAAVDFMERQGPPGNIFNAYNFGGYLIWRGFPVFVDGRADVYQDAGLLEYKQTAFVAEGWEEPLQRRDVRTAIIESDSGIGAAMAASPNWEALYRDAVAVVFRRVP